MYRSRSLFVVCIVLLLSAPFSALAIELKTAAQQSTPKYFKDNADNMSGICIDIMHAIERLDPGLRFTGYQQFVPFKRLQRQLEIGTLDVFFGLKETGARKEVLNFIDIPLYKLDYVLAARRDDDINLYSLDELSTHGKQGRVLTVLGSAASKFLKRRDDLVVDSAARSPSILLKMLVNKRGRFAFYHDLGLQSIITKNGLAGEVRIIPVSFSTYFHYAAFSKHVRDDKVERVRKALETLRNNGELGKIQRKYSTLQYIRPVAQTLP